MNMWYLDSKINGYKKQEEYVNFIMNSIKKQEFENIYNWNEVTKEIKF